MIINSMKFSNFRQFYGENSIEFGVEKENITIILGANGNGKTGIFRALMFVLYGDTKLEQDNDTYNIHLVNLDKLEENKNLPVSASVELNFEFNDNYYILKRKITSIKEDNEVLNREFEPELYLLSNSGDYLPYTKEPIDSFIHRIIEPEIREFFFFDAERMQLLDTTKSEKALSKDIQEGIIRLLQIKYLEETIFELNKLIKKKQSEINKQIKDEEIDNKIREKERAEESLDSLNNSITEYKKESQLLKNEIDTLIEKLNENTEIKDLQEKLIKEKELFKKTDENRGLHKNNTKNLLLRGIHHLANDVLETNKVFFKEYINKSSDKVPENLLDQSLEEMTCAVCRTNFDDNSSQHIIIKKLLDEYEFSSTTNLINTILKKSDHLSISEEKYMTQVQNNLQSLIENEEELENYELTIQDLNNKISSRAASIENLATLEKQLKVYKTKNLEVENKIKNKVLKYQHFKETSLRLNEEINLLTTKYKNVSKDQAIKVKLEKFRQVIEDTMHNYSSSITKELSAEIYKSFLVLLDKKDKSNYKEVIITDSFEIQLINQFGQNVVQDLSMGQGQIFTLAFILSLAKLASKGRAEINFPLFMDTPFARLSRDNRDNLINNIPLLTNQWILLLTDTEFTDTEKDIFENTNKVGKIYYLDNADGKTVVKYINNLSELKMGVQ